MGKTKENADETAEAVKTPVTPKVTEAVFTREELANSADFKTHKWLLFAVIKDGEQVTKAEAQKRVSVMLGKTI